MDYAFMSMFWNMCWIIQWKSGNSLNLYSPKFRLQFNSSALLELERWQRNLLWQKLFDPRPWLWDVGRGIVRLVRPGQGWGVGGPRGEGGARGVRRARVRVLQGTLCHCLPCWWPWIMVDEGLGVVVFYCRLHKGFSRQKDDAQNRS